MNECTALDAADVAVSAVHCERRQKKGTNSIGDQIMHACRGVDRIEKDVFVRVPAQVHDGGDIDRKPAIVHRIGEVARFVCHDLGDEQVDIEEVDGCIGAILNGSKAFL